MRFLALPIFRYVLFGGIYMKSIHSCQRLVFILQQVLFTYFTKDNYDVFDINHRGSTCRLGPGLKTGKRYKYFLFVKKISV